jgi:leader peptidase (prepilin peptidase)/N-methyltransferase
VSPEALLDLYVVALGLIVGSYLNVLIHRLPRGISTVFPRSRCPRCRAPIRPWDNVPVLSYLALGGRCRRCRAVIPWRYPAVEAVTGFLFWLSFERFEPSLADAVAGCAFSAAMIVLAMIDLEHYLLPDVVTLPGIAAGLIVQPWISWSTPREALLGAALGAGVLYAVAWGWYFWKGVWGMGMGDVKMLAMIGAFMGWQGVVATLFVASVTGSLAGAGMMLAGRMHLRSKLPFGSFLALGAILTLFAGRDLLDAYLRFAGAGHLWPGW